MTLGEYRVGITFNPSNVPLVDEIKKGGAAAIDLMETMRTGADDEKIRLIDFAQGAIEDACMWAVKAATKQPLPKPPAA